MTTGGDSGGAPSRDEGADAARPARRTSRVITAAVLGTTVEYYDFGIYGYMAAALGANFFSTGDPTSALLATFATFAVAFFVRVPGGIFFGHIGDRIGRKRALTSTIILMTAATAAIGVIPSYVTWGVWATSLLVLCRCIQGFSAGGEFGGANVFVSESAPTSRRGMHTAMVSWGTYAGSLLASLVGLLLAVAIPPETLTSWAWRIAFLLSLPLGLVGLWIRRSVEESPEFQAIQQTDDVEVAKMPFLRLFRTSPRELAMMTLLLGMGTGGYYIASVYATSYLQSVGGHEPRVAFLSTCVALVLGIGVVPLSGHLGDRFGRKPVLITSALAAALLAFPAFILMSNPSAWIAIAGQSVLFASVSMVIGNTMVACAELLPGRVRYSGVAFSNNVANTILGGTAPFVATLLISVSGNDLAPAAYFCLTAVLSLVGAIMIPETRGRELER